MSLVTLLLTDYAKSGVKLNYIAPLPSETQMSSPVFKSSANPLGGLSREVTSPNASINRVSFAPTVSLSSTINRNFSEFGLTFSSVSQIPDLTYESPVYFTESNPKPEWIDDSLARVAFDAAQEYANFIVCGSLNLVTDLKLIREACFRYLYRLQDVSEVIKEFSTDIDCTEDLLLYVEQTMGEVLYNLALTFLFEGFNCIGDVDGGSVGSLTAAAATFDYLMSAGFGESSEYPEICDNNLRVLSCVCMATANEFSLMYYYCDSYHQVQANSKLAHAASYYYTLAAAIVYTTHNVVCREMFLNFCNIKRLFYEGLMFFILSIEVGTTKGNSRRRKAVDLFDEALQNVLTSLPGERPAVEMELAWYKKRCVKFRKISKKGCLPEGSFNNKQRRSGEYKELIPVGDIRPKYPEELEDFMRDLVDREQARALRLEERKRAKMNEAHSELLKGPNYSQSNELLKRELEMSVEEANGDNNIKKEEGKEAKKSNIPDAVAAAIIALDSNGKNSASEQEVSPYRDDFNHQRTQNTSGTLLNFPGESPFADKDDFSPSEANQFEDISLITEVQVEDEDIRMKPPTVAPSATHYHLITAMLTLRTPSLKPPDKQKKRMLGDDEFAITASASHSMLSLAQTASLRSMTNLSSTKTTAVLQQEACSHCAVVIIADINLADDGLRYEARSAVAFALKGARLDQRDRIGLLVFDRFGEPSIKVIPAVEKNVEKIADTILKITYRHKFTGNNGPFLLRGIQLAMEALETCDKDVGKKVNKYSYAQSRHSTEDRYSTVNLTGNKNILLITDGLWNGMNSDGENWEMIKDQKIRQKIIDYRIPIHAFTLEDAVDHELISTLVRITAGTRGSYLRTDDAGVGKLARWIAGAMSSFKQRVASDVTIDLRCPAGILLANIVTDFYKPPPSKNYGELPGEVILPVAPLSLEQESHFLITFAVPTKLAKSDVIKLGDCAVKFYDSVRNKLDEQLLVFKNICSKRVISREIHTWVNSLFAKDCVGGAYMMSPSANRSMIRGSESVTPTYSVFTKDSGGLTLISIENTQIKLARNTTLLIKAVEMNRIELELSGGSLNITAANQCDILVDVEGTYLFKIAPGTLVQIDYDKTRGEVNANCVIGSVRIEMTKKEAKDSMTLYAPRQTTSRIPFSFIVPWVIDEKTFFTWIERDNDNTRRIKNAIRIQTHVWRTKIAEALRKSAIFFHREMRHGTLPQKKYAYKICRQIIIFGLLTILKQTMTNSIAYSTKNVLLDKLRKVIDDTMEIAQTCNRPTRNMNQFFTISEWAEAVGRERSYGGSKLYSTSDQESQMLSQMSAKARFEHMLAEDNERLSEEAEAAKNRANAEAILTLYKLWDFSVFNLVEVRNMLTVGYDLPNLRDAVPLYVEVLTAIDPKKAINDAQFAQLFLFFSKEMSQNQFFSLVSILSKKVTELGKLIEENRLNRALFAVFNALDEDSLGYIKVPELCSLLTKTFGDNLPNFKRIQVLTQRILNVRDEMIDEMSRNLIIDYIKEERPYWRQYTTEEMAENVLVTLHVFLLSMPAYFEDIKSEQVIHQQLNQLHGQIDVRNKLPNTVNGILGKQRTDEEKKHLITWDLRHIFDGIELKNIREVTDPEYVLKDPDLLQAICAPLCLITNIKAPVVTIRKARDSRNGSIYSFGEEKEDIPRVKGASITEEGVAATYPPIGRNEDIEENIKVRKEPNLFPSKSPSVKIELKSLTSAVREKRPVSANQNGKEDLSPLDSPTNAASERRSIVTKEGKIIAKRVDEEIEREPEVDVMARENLKRILAQNKEQAENGYHKGSSEMTPSAGADEKSTTPLDERRVSSTSATPQRVSDNEFDQIYTDYWKAVVRLLKDDWKGFFRSLNYYPPLSITHRQALRLAEHLKDPRLEPTNNSLKSLPIFSQLLSWLRLILRIAYLTHNYNKPLQVPNKLLSDAVAMHKNALLLAIPALLPDNLKIKPTPPVVSHARAFTHNFVHSFDPPPIDDFGKITTFSAEPPSLSPPMGKSALLLRFKKTGSAISNNQLSGREETNVLQIALKKYETSATRDSESEGGSTCTNFTVDRNAEEIKRQEDEEYLRAQSAKAFGNSLDRSNINNNINNNINIGIAESRVSKDGTAVVNLIPV